ncbi:MAG: RHS repeat-associated core domain-containing protein [Acidobacteriota bacterium]
MRYIAFNAADNRLSGTSYDASGNLTTDLTGRSFAYEAENRQVSYNGGSVTVNASYDYDGEGRRVRRIQNGVTTVFVSNAQGQLAAEYSSQAAGGPGGTSYVMADHLGSTRLVTKADGTVRGRHDYLPFGEEIGTSYGGRSAIAGYGATDLRHKFTAKERDSESNLDYFGARYFSGAQGRFTSVDPENAGAYEDDPQSWNGYAYSRNNPLVFTDPTGERYERCVRQGDQQQCTKISDADWDKYKHTNRRELIFQGGKIFARDKKGNQGAQVGTFRQIDVDLPDSAIQIAKGVYETIGTADSFAAALVTNAAMDAIFAPAIVGKLGGKLIGLGLSRLPIGRVFPVLDRLSPKILRQMQTRGWTRVEIQEAFEKGQQFPAVNRLRGANTPATRYVHPSTGKSVVIDNASGEVIQVGAPGFRF